jgi:hypothetical protein
MENKIPIETVVNINDYSILWADLNPRYNGYQISNFNGLVRSMKFYKKYPFGILIKPDDKGMIKLSNSLNQVETIDVNKLFHSIQKKDFIIPTNSTYTRSRNPIITSKSDHMKNKNKYADELKKPSGFHFTIID